MAGLLIGDVSKRTGISTVEALLFVRKAQGLGFSLDEIGDILRRSYTSRGW